MFSVACLLGEAEYWQHFVSQRRFRARRAQASAETFGHRESMADIVIFEGREWIDARIEYPKLPVHLRTDDNKWDRKLRALGIRSMLPDVRTTERNNIANLMEEGRAPKSKYIVKTVWESAIASAVAATGTEEDVAPTHTSEDVGGRVGSEDASITQQQSAENADANAGEGNDRVVAQENQQPLAMEQIILTDAEKLRYNGQELEIKAFGERTVEKLRLDFRDSCNAIGIYGNNIPDTIAIETVAVHGVHIRVLTWDDFCHLTFVKARGHPVAAAIKTWIVHTVFAVQYQSGIGATQQASFASRDCKYATETYVGHLDDDDKILYAFDFCAAEDLEKEYPGTVSAITGPDREGKRVVKIGCGRRGRIKSVRNELNHILAGQDPRPFAIQRVMGVTDAELQSVEKAVHEEFSDARIGHEERLAIRGPGNTNYTELFVLDLNDKERVVREIVRVTEQQTRKKMADAEAALTMAAEFEEKYKEARTQNLLQDAKIHAQQDKIQALQDKNQSLKTVNENQKADLDARENECKRLETTMAQILPRKMSVLKSMLSRV